MDDLGRWMRRVLDEVAPPVDPRGIVESVTRPGRRRWPIAVGAAAVVVLLVGGGYWLFSGEPNPGVAHDTTTTSLESVTTTTAAILETLHPSAITCSSELPDFPCSNLIDGDPATEWQAPNGSIGAVITVEFAASGAPPLPAGWRRDFLLYSDSWLKDADLNTGAGHTVEPLPFHGMSRYPYGPEESYPRDDAHQRYLSRYDTRRMGQQH